MKHKPILLSLLIFSALLLSACTVNIKTVINEDGSGQYITEFGFNEEDKGSLTEMGYGSLDDYCTDAASDMPPNTVMRVEQREEEIFCVLTVSYTTLDELKTYYGEGNVEINRLEIVDNIVYYDISVDSSGDTAEGAMAGNWILVLPGSIQSHNADDKDGNTLTWTIAAGTVEQLQAQSKIGGLNLPDWMTYLAIALGCLCCLSLLVIIVVVVVLVMRKRSQAPSTPDVINPQI